MSEGEGKPCKVGKLKKPTMNKFNESQAARHIPPEELRDHQQTIYTKSDVEKRPPSQKAELECVICHKKVSTYNYLAGKSFVCDKCIGNYRVK